MIRPEASVTPGSLAAWGGVAKNLVEISKVFVRRFSNDGPKFVHPFLEKGGDLLDCGHSGNRSENALGGVGSPRAAAGRAVPGGCRFVTSLSGKLRLIIKHL